ncbi:hypothetical protein HB779_10735 [Phyllobacterium sp. 628]|uniref:hypothetical protein n=1 Tax=Phyllobacterium sp. 628 TaxID=2718938 RepID=UPI00166235C5|nr:hypothetical protein [Phyllobacterium sp. 628]QND52335.1 hypothetical protein HB779_10735 [Phyllobacterium sp. 628]
MIKRLLAGLALSLVAGSAAQAQSCASNFKSDGVPLVTSVNYKSWQIFPKLDPKKALANVAQGVAVEGFSDVQVDKSLGAVTAVQEGSGATVPPKLRVVVRKSGKGSRVDAIFIVNPGWVSPESTTRSGICRVIDSANG